jgi:xanthine/uracil permease
MAVMRQDSTLGELFSELSQETSTLIRQEVQLAKAELSRKAAQAGKEAAFIAAGGAIAYAGFLALIAAAIMGVAEFLPGWLSALLVGVIVAGVGYLLLQKGISSLKEINPAPRRTIETLKEDKEWLKQQVT